MILIINKIFLIFKINLKLYFNLIYIFLNIFFIISNVILKLVLNFTFSYNY